MASSVDPDQTAPLGAVCSGSTLFASILNSSVLLGNYLQQTTSADNIFRCIFFLGALRVKFNNRHITKIENKTILAVSERQTKVWVQLDRTDSEKAILDFDAHFGVGFKM